MDVTGLRFALPRHRTGIGGVACTALPCSWLGPALAPSAGSRRVEMAGLNEKLISAFFNGSLSGTV